jgi:two-component system response regulator YesN
MSPITYKNRFRIEKAKQMLLYGVTDISNIAEKLGFDSAYSFSKIFKMYAGITPSDFAKNKN